MANQVTKEKVVKDQIKFAKAIAKAIEAPDGEVSYIDLLDTLAQLGLEIHPMSLQFGNTSSLAYLKELGME
jgi:hypothetical protein